MKNDFQFMVFLMAVIALLFVGLSLMPDLRHSAASAQAQAPITLAATTPPAVAAPAPPSPPPSAAAPASRAPKYVFRRGRTEASRDLNWLFTRHAVILLKEPDGDPYTPVTICDAPLLILPGTRLWPIKTEGEWVMVKSPSQLLGWVPQSEVSNRAPIVNRTY